MQALAALGWTDGRNLRMDVRWGRPDINGIGALAQELVGLQPDIIVTGGTLATAAVQRETRTIPVVPVVFANVADPVASGLVARLDRPSGNITGFAVLEASLGGKWLELLSEIAPALKRASIMFDPDDPLSSAFMPLFEMAARSLKVVPIIAPVRSNAEIETAIIALGARAGSRPCRPWGVDSCSRIARRSYRRRPETTYRRSMGYLSSPETAVCSPTETTWRTPFVVPPPMWIAFCAARSRAISRCSSL